MKPFEPRQFGRYHLLERFAIGGMAEIYKAKTFGVDGFEKLVAVKRILPQCSADKDFISMLIDEAKLCVTLSHANIVQVFDLDKVEDDYFISMEFVNGVNLKEIIYRCQQKGVHIPEEISIFIISEACKGLDYAHRKADPYGKPLNIVHRDVSPQNILISYEGEVKIVDFGIAKAAMNISQTMTGILKGKVAYMSPEQAVGSGIDHRSDIFATGVVLYEMLTGHKLFAGDSQIEVLNKIRVTHIDTAKFPRSISSDLKKILTKALAHDVKERFSTAGEMQAALTKYLYSAHSDFTPQHLAAFVKKLFADAIPKQGDDKLAPLAHHDILGTSVLLSPDKEAPAKRPSGILKKAAMAAAALVVLGSAVLAYYKFVYLRPVLTTPTAIAVKIEPPKPVPAPVQQPVVPPKPADAVPQEPQPNPADVKPKEVPEMGSVRVVSNPAGARIFLNGRDLGLATPATIKDLPVGKKQVIKLTKDKFEAATRGLTLKDASLASLRADLKPVPEPAEAATPVPPPVVEPAPTAPAVAEPTRAEEPTVTDGTKLATLRLSSEPSGAEVFIDAEFKGTTPVTINNVKPGTLSLVVNKEGKIKYTQKVSLKAGEKKDLGTIQLGDLYGTVSVTSTPPRAAIIFDGENIGVTTPVTIKNVRRDKQHNIKLVLEGYKPWEKAFTMRDVEDKKFNIMMEE